MAKISWDTPYSKGDRRNLIKVSTYNINVYRGSCDELIDGDAKTFNFYGDSERDSGAYFLFEFDKPVCIRQFKLIKQPSDNKNGYWLMQVSNDNNNYQSISDNILLNNGTFNLNNTKCYKYYKLKNVSEYLNTDFLVEIEFGLKIDYKFLLEQNNLLYTIKSEFYDLKKGQYKPITGVDINNITDEDLKKYGFDDVGDILTETDVDKEKFKPIDKLKTINDGKFNILVKELD